MGLTVRATVLLLEENSSSSRVVSTTSVPGGYWEGELLCVVAMNLSSKAGDEVGVRKKELCQVASHACCPRASWRWNHVVADRFKII